MPSVTVSLASSPSTFPPSSSTAPTLHRDNGPAKPSEDMSVAEIKEPAKQQAQRGEPRCLCSFSFVPRRVRSTLHNHAKAWVNLKEFKAENVPGKRGLLWKEFSDFQQREGSDLTQRTHAIESKLTQVGEICCYTVGLFPPRPCTCAFRTQRAPLTTTGKWSTKFIRRKHCRLDVIAGRGFVSERHQTVLKSGRFFGRIADLADIMMASRIHINMNKKAKLRCAIACDNAAELRSSIVLWLSEFFRLSTSHIGLISASNSPNFLQWGTYPSVTFSVM
ncbi:hypothetical protein F5888DRAFT_1250629 [Russula emetica]|nr:hypothetical protein F5888DRAFT_1250629 [Russula emetica]